MSCTVYANGMEVACKASDGKTIAATPDVCLSPPTPPAGPVPIPYPNTAMASDTTNGSKTVQISGQEVVLKDQSTFKKSTGDEAATKSLGMGVVSHQIQGEVNFTSWSMNVKVEGENAARHLDLTLHNEMCTPANTPPWVYTASQLFATGNVCEGMDHLKLSPYKDGCPSDSSGSKGTPHHLIPDRCTTGMSGYAHADAPCICVQGKNQHTGSHRACHRVFDPIERVHGTNGTPFEYQTASYAAATSAGGAQNPPRQLSEEEKACVEAQLGTYYKAKPPNGPGLSNRSPLNPPTGASGKVNEFYEDAAAIFSD